MYSTYRELLSFTSIDYAIDKLFKVYLDVKLIAFALESPGDPKYWADVREFRRISLDPYTGLTPEDDKPTPNADELTKFEFMRAYLYWFDIRSDYWFHNRPDKALLSVVNPKSDLPNLKAEAAILESRLEQANKYQEEFEKGLAKDLDPAWTADDGLIKRSIVLLHVIVEDPKLPGRPLAEEQQARRARTASRKKIRPARTGSKRKTPQSRSRRKARRK
jgi:hypothetical protein